MRKQLVAAHSIPAVLRIRTGCNADPEPAFKVNADPDPVQDPGFWRQILKNKIYFLSKIEIYLSVGLHKDPSFFTLLVLQRCTYAQNNNNTLVCVIKSYSFYSPLL